MAVKAVAPLSAFNPLHTDGMINTGRSTHREVGTGGGEGWGMR
jgi:hypothetical protein